MQTLREITVRAIKTALIETGGNKNKAAEILGISVKTVRNYCKQDPELRSFYCPPYAWVIKRLRAYSSEEDAWQALQGSGLWKCSSLEERRKMAEALELIFKK